MDLIFATHNLNKVKEATSILKGFNVISLEDLKDFDEVEEDGETFCLNAFKKANYYYQKYKQPTFADDSGLVVESLGGAPGVYSARYAGEHANYQQNNQYLLKNLKDIKERQAYFITVICFIDENSHVHYFEGRVNGSIAFELSGNNGFGYDPLFIVDGMDKTLAQLPNEAKNSLSHRFFALQQLINHLKKEVK